MVTSRNRHLPARISVPLIAFLVIGGLFAVVWAIAAGKPKLAGAIALVDPVLPP